MARATISTSHCCVTSVRVFQVSTELIAKTTVILASQILVGIAVSIPQSRIKTTVSLAMIAGVCNETSDSTFVCACPADWQGDHCEIPVNYCFDVTCANNGVCRSLSSDYKCECLGGSYSGRHCEVKSSQLKVHQAMSRSFAYVAICALIIVALFIIVMDVLKYAFGIDPVREDRERHQRKMLARRRHTLVILRFIYVHAP